MLRRLIQTDRRNDLFQRDLTNINRSYAPRRYRNERVLIEYFERQLRGIKPGSGKALEVGAGDGVFSCILALRGYEVDAIDPYRDGADSQSAEFFSKITRSESVCERVSLLETDLSALNHDHYDLVVLHNVINHLDEEACISIHREAESFGKYVEMFNDIRYSMSEGASLLITDCARLNFFGSLRIRNPFAPDIDWKLHQQPKLWLRVLENAGFADVNVRWNSPSILGALGRGFLANRVGAFFTSSHFRITALSS